ncbi:TatD family hydrolase [Desulfogranum mediterraneum]|uniref:TatD family hydrolase n=1 Tax=Desulfogranum mediterraneum TaxID=160661 RepID=UPI000429A9AF|nr:TatD family hydrolase [Desulfogranum mediterraneum]
MTPSLQSVESRAAHYCDAHLHLQDERIGGRLAALLALARQRGVDRFLTNTVSEEQWAGALELGRTIAGVIPFLGIHPWYAESVAAGWRERLAALIARGGCGLGEVGLDRSCAVPLERQLSLFQGQLELALEYRCPLVIHCVRHWGRLLDLLEGAGLSPEGPAVMVHSFSGSLETMERLLRLGVYCSFSARLLLGHETRLQQVFRAIPLEQVLLETDAPDQALWPRGPCSELRLNAPGCIVELYQQAARLRGCDPTTFTTTLWKNGTIFTHRAAAGP